LGDFVKHAFKGAVFTLPFLTTFMDKIGTLSLVDGTSMQVDYIHFFLSIIHLFAVAYS